MNYSKFLILFCLLFGDSSILATAVVPHAEDDPSDMCALRLVGADWDDFITRLNAAPPSSIKKVECLYCPGRTEAHMSALFSALGRLHALEELRMAPANEVLAEGHVRAVMHGVVMHVRSPRLRILELGDYRFTNQDITRLTTLMSFRMWPMLERIAIEGEEATFATLNGFALICAGIQSLRHLCMPQVGDYRERRHIVGNIALERRARGLLESPLEVWFGNDPIEGDVEDICYHLPQHRVIPAVPIAPDLATTHAAAPHATAAPAASSSSAATEATWLADEDRDSSQT